MDSNHTRSIPLKQGAVVKCVGCFSEKRQIALKIEHTSFFDYVVGSAQELHSFGYTMLFYGSQKAQAPKIYTYNGCLAVSHQGYRLQNGTIAAQRNQKIKPPDTKIEIPLEYAYFAREVNIFFNLIEIRLVYICCNSLLVQAVEKLLYVGQILPLILLSKNNNLNKYSFFALYSFIYKGK